MGKTKVLYIITALDQGGAQQSVLSSVKQLPCLGFETYLATGKGGRLDKKAQDEIKNLYFLSALKHDVSWRYALYDVWAVWQMGRLMRKMKPDIVHTNAPKAGVLGRIAARVFWRKAKVVHTFHGLGFAKEQGEKHFRFFVRTEKFCAKLTDALVFVSKKNASEAAKLGICKKKSGKIIRAGIDFNRPLPASFNPAAKRASLHIPPTGRIVLSLGNFKPLKNPLHFVLAAYTILTKHPNTYFIYTGDGPLKKAAENLIQHLNIDTHVLFPGWRDDADELLAMSDVYLTTSLREGLPVSVLEAQAHKVPVVGYDIDGMCEIIRDNHTGFLVPANDIKKIAAKVCVLLRYPRIYERLIQNIEKRDYREFSTAVMLRRQAQLYRRLVFAQRRKPISVPISDN